MTCNKPGSKREGYTRKRSEKDFTHYEQVLDFILAHGKNEERQYLEVEIVGHRLFGLLDTGDSRTFLGKKGWDVLMDSRLFLDTSKRSLGAVANGQKTKVLALWSYLYGYGIESR